MLGGGDPERVPNDMIAGRQARHRHDFVAPARATTSAPPTTSEGGGAVVFSRASTPAASHLEGASAADLHFYRATSADLFRGAGRGHEELVRAEGGAVFVFGWDEIIAPFQNRLRGAPVQVLHELAAELGRLDDLDPVGARGGDGRKKVRVGRGAGGAGHGVKYIS